MEIFNLFSVYIIFGTYLLLPDAQTIGSNLLTASEAPNKDIIQESKRVHKQNEQENKEKIEALSLTQWPESQKKLNENNPTTKRKSMQNPLNIIIDTKPQTIPIKIPLVIKTGNVKPAPAHYIRLKGDMYKKHSKNKSENYTSPTKTTSKRIPSKAKVKSNSNDKYFRKSKGKCVKYYVDEGNSDEKYLLKESKSGKRRKHKKLGKMKNTAVERTPETRKTTNNSHTANEKEADYEFNKMVNIENNTNSILLTKLQVPNEYQTELIANDTSNLQGNVSQTPLVIPFKDLEILPTPTIQNILETVNDSDCNMQELATLPDFKPAVEGSPIVTVNNGNESFESITINDHNYQEVEERGQRNPEQTIADEGFIEPRAPESLNDNFPANPYNTYINNYPIEGSNYLKYLTESNPAFDELESLYPQGNLIAPYYTYPQDVAKIFSPPINRVVQDIYGPNSRSNDINICPENSVGRIWRTWKDTQIKINTPVLANNRLPGRHINYVLNKELSARTPSLINLQHTGLDRHYHNFNNVWPHPYSCQFN